MSIAENLSRVRERIAAAAQKAGRGPHEIALMAVSKTVEPARIREAYDAGQRLFGENRVQEFAGKYGALNDLAGAEWHMIGHLQSNKAAKAAELFGAIDSVDSLRLAERIDAAASKLNRSVDVLIELNLGNEAAKTGIREGSGELNEILLAGARLQHVRIRGLMTVPPFTEDPEGARPYFRKLRDLRDQIAARKIPGVSMDVLSMGMSHDFEVAIEEGSTCVRVGTAIFGARLKT